MRQIYDVILDTKNVEQDSRSIILMQYLRLLSKVVFISFCCLISHCLINDKLDLYTYFK